MHPNNTPSPVARHFYCTNCGIELPEGTRFCDECGARQRSRDERDQAPRRTAEPDQWEYCEIVFRDKAWKREFVAQGSGPAGLRDILSVVAGFGAPKHGWLTGKSVEEMVNKLVAAGWEPQPKGTEWYSHRFRHSIRA